MPSRKSNHTTAGWLATEEVGSSVGQFESKGGYFVRFEDDRWRLSKDHVVIVGAVTELLQPEVADGFRQALMHYAKEYSAAHVLNVTLHFQHYLRFTGADRLSVVSLTNYRASLSKNVEYRLGSLRGFLKSWHELGYPGVEPQVIEVLKGWRLKGNEKGSAVRSLDPKEGPLDDIELEGLNTAVGQLFEQGKIDLAELGQALLLTHLGVRRIQISHLKIKDLVVGKKQETEPAYLLMMPQAKQRAEDAPFRGSLKPKKLRKQLWLALQMQARFVAEWVGQSIMPLTSSTVGELPLFPNMAAWPTGESCDSEEKLRSFLVNDQLHTKTSVIFAALRKIVLLGNVRGRDGDLLFITPRRLRYTTGSRAAREGFGKWVIANLLDHKDTQNSGIYTDNHPNFTKVIDKAMGRTLAPLAQAYMGKLVGSKTEARYGDDPKQQITDGGSDVGVCGSHGYCGAFAPIACYTCIHFQPLLDAPHRKILERLLDERERIKDYVNASDEVVVIATDRTILAVSQVIQLCDERRVADAEPTLKFENGHG